MNPDGAIFGSTMEPFTAQWIDLTMQQPSFPELWLGEDQPVGSWDDADGDLVGDFEDNCIGDYNPDQADDDGDGLGNVCDRCPSKSGDADQANANLDAEIANYDPNATEYTTPLSSASTADDLKKRAAHFQGDACEKVSQARSQNLAVQKAPAHASTHWITAGVTKNGKRAVEDIDRASMLPALGFMGEGWW